MALDHTASSLDELKQLIRTIPIIDNHAHNLLRLPGQKTGDLLTITTEASSDALLDTPTSLAHLRAVKQLRRLYGLDETATWSNILEKRAAVLENKNKTEELYRNCFAGTQTLLVDDGLATSDVVERYDWHGQFTTSPCKRIVRIETIAADILSALHQQNKLPVGVAVADEEACGLAWVAFITAFEQAIVACIEDDEVCGFKSVICYRTGLDIHPGRDIEVSEDGLRSFRRHYLPECVSRKFRVEAKGMNDALVISTCKLIAAGYRQRGRAKPLQFHTGLGDNDISLLDANPACLQPLIKHFPTVPIVLLHSSYPYTREAGYLATVYKNCYLDIGEVFPMVSRDGQNMILRAALELTPWSKLLWSTDGHFYPETFGLANLQGREAVEMVFVDYVEAGDLTVQDAANAVKAFFFENANRLYDLKLGLDGPALPVRAAKAQPTEEENTSLEGTTANAQARSGVAQMTHNSLDTGNGNRLSDFFTANHTNEYVFVQWLDYMGSMRTRCLPSSEFKQLITSNGSIRISNGNLGTLQNDHMTAVCNPVGSICVVPDTTLASLRRMARPRSASIMAGFTTVSERPLTLDPRSMLVEALKDFQIKHGIDFLVGFEIEITFCRRQSSGENSKPAFAPLDNVHAWGTLSDEQYTTSLDIVLECATALKKIGIDAQQVHAEAGQGQYEYVLPPLPPVQAVDTLIQARQCIQHIAASHSLRATCHPMPFPGIGTAAHAHISFNRSTTSDAPAADLDKLQMSFMAAVLEHLPALCAITMPQASSYGRVVEDSWTGGTWCAWGNENREVPLRKSDTYRWEFRFLDGFANMYLALLSIFAVGKAGVESGKDMTMKDCTVNPSMLSDSEKEELGIVRKLPTSIEEALGAAETDTELEAAMPEGMLKHYLAMRKAEQEMLNEMDEGTRKVWLMERY